MLPDELWLDIISYYVHMNIKRYSTLSLISKKFYELSKNKNILRIVFNMLDGLNESN
jgi:hypothetical protein